jgi:hypothetical protein
MAIHRWQPENGLILHSDSKWQAYGAARDTFSAFAAVQCGSDGLSAA